MKDSAIRSILLISLALCFLGTSAWCNQWQTYAGNNARTGITPERLKIPLSEVWVWHSPDSPKPAWPPPAKRDIWHGHRKLRPLNTYDRAFHTVISNGLLYFGSSADDKVYCLDAETGEQKWEFFTEAPVRLAPSVSDDRVYFASDDGCVYCLSAADGRLIWRRRMSSDVRWMPGNGRMISAAPIRTGVLVDDGIAYCFSGIFSSQTVRGFALNAKDGSIRWQIETEDVSPQGYMLASDKYLYVPTGRTTPAIFDKKDGRFIGFVQGQGGAYALLYDSELVEGPGRTSGQLDLVDTESRESIATFDGLRMLIDGRISYLLSEIYLSALDRVEYKRLTAEQKEISAQIKKTSGREAERLRNRLAEIIDDLRRTIKWQSVCLCPYSLIKAGDLLFAGGDDKVVAIDSRNGNEVWSAEVAGRAYGLAVSNGSLFVSTDKGKIYCFRNENVERERVIARPPVSIPYPEDELTQIYRDAARKIVSKSKADKGYCIVLDAEIGRLAYEIAQLTEFKIICLEDEPEKVRKAREIIDSAGLYGSRITVHEGTLADHRYTSFVANLIVSDGALISGKLPVDPDEILRMLRPFGGVAVIGCARGRLDFQMSRNLTDDPEWQIESNDGSWITVRRGKPSGAGEWTNLYANPKNIACSYDELRAPVTIQWFGEPGPERIIDRHHRPMSSLFKNGRIFIPADDAVIAADAYNGTKLWELAVPNSRRVGTIKDAGQMVVADDYLYVVTCDQCWKTDVATGKVARIIRVPQLIPEQKKDWGYVAVSGDTLFGTGQKVGASMRRLGIETITMLEGDFRPVVVSDYLFALDRQTGEMKWSYRNGVIMNNCIAVDGNSVFLIESRNDEMMKDTTGRVRIDKFCAAETYLVRLDSTSGRKIWERPFSFPFEHIMFLATDDGVILVTGTRNVNNKVQYDLFGFRAEDGKPIWSNNYQPGFGPGGSHGEQWQHPVICDGKVYLRPFKFDLQTGKKEDYVFNRGGHGCGGVSASRWYLYGRGGNPRMYPIETKETSGIRLTHTTRPGCWINIVPAGGLILIPESSSGCTCAYPIQTSLALVPKDKS